jgi:plasmid stabilization system protein ParE
VAQSAVVWTLHARQDLLSALRYLVQEAKSPQAAEALFERVEAAAASLCEFPREAGSRNLGRLAEKSSSKAIGSWTFRG